MDDRGKSEVRKKTLQVLSKKSLFVVQRYEKNVRKREKSNGGKIGKKALNEHLLKKVIFCEKKLCFFGKIQKGDFAKLETFFWREFLFKF